MPHGLGIILEEIPTQSMTIKSKIVTACDSARSYREPDVVTQACNPTPWETSIGLS